MRATAKDKSLRRIGQDPERRRHAGGFGGVVPPTSTRTGHGEVGHQPTSMLSRSSAPILSAARSRT